MTKEKLEASSEPEVITESPEPTEQPFVLDIFTPEPTEQPSAPDIFTPEPTGNAGGETPSPEPTGNAGEEETSSPEATGNAGGETPSPEPTGNGRGDKTPSAEPTGSAVPVAPDGGSQTIQPDKKTGISPDSAEEPKATESAENAGMQTEKLQVKTQNDKKSGKQTKAKASAKKKTVPVFTLTRKKNKKGQRYIQLRVKKGEGNYIEVWAKVENSSYKKLKLSENRLTRLNNTLKFKYSISGKHFYFKIRTYQMKKRKKVYSKMSGQKEIITR